MPLVEELVVDRIELTITGTVGPLFLIHELQEYDEEASAVAPTASAAVTAAAATTAAALQRHWPQFYKRQHGWRLSIEEVQYLLWLSGQSPILTTTSSMSTSTSAGVKHDRTPSLPSSVSVSLRLHGGPLVASLATSLAAASPAACAVYRCLTADHGFRLRHGSQFGSLFIGYAGTVRQHGEVLFFLGPLPPLAAVRAARVAGSVGKRAEVVYIEEGRGGAAVLVRRQLAANKGTASGGGGGGGGAVPPKIKKQRQR